MCRNASADPRALENSEYCGCRNVEWKPEYQLQSSLGIAPRVPRACESGWITLNAGVSATRPKAASSRDTFKKRQPPNDAVERGVASPIQLQRANPCHIKQRFNSWSS